MSKMAIAYSMAKKKAKGCAHGGEMNCNEGCYAKGGDVYRTKEKGVHKSVNPLHPDTMGMSHAGDAVRVDDEESARSKHLKILKELRTMKSPNLMAEGGEMEEPEDDVHPSVKRIMMSRGGMIANDSSPIADSMPAEFDDLALRDDLEFNYTGANSGDELGNAQESHDREDIISRIMRSRAKKDRMPRPA